MRGRDTVHVIDFAIGSQPAVEIAAVPGSGLRKAACRRLAEAGCSANEIAAISGHVSLREVERYTRAADQARMARNAVGRIRTATESGKPG
ncbi:MAG: phage integrase family protein [Alphaproteobacteria bacterium]|nr:MAG: phage integrase family protein [Alphaproteobacteria bacterium]